MDILVGSVAGITSFTLTLPVDFVKQWMQSKHSVQDIKGILRTNGPKVLWRGAGIGNAVIAPQMAIKFGVFNRLQERGVQPIPSALVAGFVDGAFLGPVLAMQAHQQMNTHITLRESWRHMVTHYNPIAFSWPMALRNSVYTGVVFGPLAKVEKKLFDKHTPLTTWMTAFLLNIPATVLCSPFDVWRASQVVQLTRNQPLKLTNIRPFQGFPSLLLAFALRFPLTVALNELFRKELGI